MKIIEKRNTKMLSLESLIVEIEQLENDGIIQFEEFKQLKFNAIKERFFAMPQFTQMKKAIIKIEDKRNNKEGPSKLTEVTEIYEGGKLARVKTKTTYF